MEFKLNEYHRNVSDEEFIADMIRVANELNQNCLTGNQYQEKGKYHRSSIARRFNGWNNALTKAGLNIHKAYNKNVNNIDVSNDELLDDIRFVAKQLNKNTLTTSEYAEYGKHGRNYICYRFKTWENALKLAGLNETGFHHKVEKIDLLNDIERVWIKLGRQPTTTDIKNGASKYSLNSYSRHFGSWRKALEAFVEYINDDTVETADNADNETEEKIIVTKAIPKTVDTHKTKRDINLRLRFKVMQRDNFKCCMCGASPATDPNVILHIDHIKPWSKGGETVIENLQTLCSKCNLGKSDLEL